MSEWTPETGDVREGFARHECLNALGRHSESLDAVAYRSEGRAAFHRWLAAHDADVRARALRGIREAWTNAGPAPAYHAAAMTNLHNQWPTLAEAIEEAVDAGV